MASTIIPLRFWQDPPTSSTSRQTLTPGPGDQWERIDSPRPITDKITHTAFEIQKVYLVDHNIFVECTLPKNGSTSTIQAIWDSTFSALYLTGGDALPSGPDPCIRRKQRLHIELPDNLREYVVLNGLIIRGLNNTYDNSALNPLAPHAITICYIPANANISDVVKKTVKDVADTLHDWWTAATQSIAEQLAPYIPGDSRNNS